MLCLSRINVYSEKMRLALLLTRGHDVLLNPALKCQVYIVLNDAMSQCNRQFSVRQPIINNLSAYLIKYSCVSYCRWFKADFIAHVFILLAYLQALFDGSLISGSRFIHNRFVWSGYCCHFSSSSLVYMWLFSPPHIKKKSLKKLLFSKLTMFAGVLSRTVAFDISLPHLWGECYSHCEPLENEARRRK